MECQFERIALEDLGRFAEAERCYLRALAINPDYAEAHLYLAVALEKAGRTEDARVEIARLHDLGRQGLGVGNYLALIHAALGEREPALAALELGLEDHSQQMGFLNLDPGIEILRDEPRFRAVMEQVGLA